jgi:hemolysin D
MITAILVTEGQMVELGQALIMLDKTQTEADERRLLSERSVALAKRNRRLALVELLRLSLDAIPLDEEVTRHPALGGDAANGQILLEEYKIHVSQRQGLESQIIERQAEWASNQKLVEKFTVNVPLAKKRLDALEKLYLKKMVGLSDYLNAKIYYNEQIYGLDSENKRSEQLLAAIKSAEKQLSTLVAQGFSETLGELNELTKQLESIDQEIIKTRDLASKQNLYAPVRGTVKGLLTNTVGGIVTPAQILMEIVPIGDTLEVEAFLSNQDIGYVKSGQKAEIKIATYPFTKYGVINGLVTHVADDATVEEKQGLLLYRVRLVMEKSSILVDGQDQPLMPGMAVSAEIATDKRRLIEFVLSPLLKMKDESFRER